jgi:ADP-dependent NAD(P)H-hydrate dehydratase / NAD(P)H-hydrate epimerase
VIRLEQVVTIKEMKEIEQKTYAVQHISSFDLMVKVGKEIYKTFQKEDSKSKTFLLLCGTGNNGGDALVFGEEAFKQNKKVHAVIIGQPSKQTEESLLMTKRYQDQNIELSFVKHYRDFIDLVDEIKNIDIIIDGLFGIGLSKEVTGLYKDVIDWMNQQKIKTLSIDCPSGLNADTGQIMGTAVKADLTYTIEAYKQGLLINDGLDCTKEIKVIHVGMESIPNQKYLYDTFQPMPTRKHNSHKYHYKNVLTIGGQVGVMGALTLAGQSALVSGVGLSTIATNIQHQDHFVRSIPELMYEVIQDQKDLLKLINKKDAILFGLGIKASTPFEQMIFDTLIPTDIPLVLDAAGILFLKQKKHSKNQRIIITPHNGEFAKLMDVDVNTISQNPTYYINQCINIYHCEVVLKGPSTIYANQNQMLYLNQGTPALAKAGSGDVLAGIILTFAARNLPIEQAILLHMFAGQEAKSKKHVESILAQDIIDSIHLVYKKYG